MPDAKRKLKPVLDGNWWLIGPSPSLDDLLTGPIEKKQRTDGIGRPELNAPVDHHIFQAPDGSWHLWGCVRATAVGRILFHWETKDIESSPWRATGEVFRADKACGESLDPGDEFIQSPYFLEHDGTLHMFYGGGSCGQIDDGPADDPRSRFQMCLMTSTDGRHWTRHTNGDGTSRLFEGPGHTRDPFLMQIDGLWHMYFCGESAASEWRSTTFLRTSQDLFNWSDATMIHWDKDLVYANETTKRAVECPFVVFKEGYYYLFRTVDYNSGETHVFRSEDPHDFGIGEVRDKHVCRFSVAAPELYTIGNRHYVSSNHNPPLGTQMSRMRWVEDE